MAKWKNLLEKFPKANDVLKLHTTKKQLPMLVTDDVIETLDDEKAAKKAAEICAKKLEKVYLSLQKQYPGQEELDVYYDEKWMKAINELLRNETKDIDKVKLFDFLKIKLANLWYESKRSWPGYFEDSPFGGRGAWFTISKKSKSTEKDE